LWEPSGLDDAHRCATATGQFSGRYGDPPPVRSSEQGIAGQNDATLGVTAGERDLVDVVWSPAISRGAMASPSGSLSAWRDVRTLAVRATRQASSTHRSERCSRDQL